MPKLNDISPMLQGHAQKIKLSGGVVGKACWVLIFYCTAVASIMATGRNEAICITVIILLSIVILFILWRIINFADKNPQAAILEGAEFLIHKQMTMGSKEKPVIENGGDIKEGHPIVMSIADATIPDAQGRLGNS